MAMRTSSARWQGNLKDGSGTVALASGAFEGSYSFVSRFEEGTGTNPEELIAAAHAACYSMFLSNVLATAGFTPTSVDTKATVHLNRDDRGPVINRIDLVVTGDVPGIDAADFAKHAETAKEGCPVSRVLAATEITLNAKLA